MGGVHAHPFDLHHKGSEDQKRHIEKLGDALRKRLPDLIADESIISTDSKGRTVKFPLRSLGQYRFRYDPRDGADQVGAGDGTGGLQPGDVIGRDPAPGQCSGTGGGEAGEGEGEEVYEVEIELSKLIEMMLEELGLPNLEERQAPKKLTVPETRYNDVARKGPRSNLHMRRSIVENIKRNARESGDAHVGGLNRDDLRFRSWREEQTPISQAVVFCIMDTSGSMTANRKYLARSFYYWMTAFLRQRYTHVEIVFISHDTRAEVVDENRFFHASLGGGTTCSSGLRLMDELIAKTYPPAEYNLYGFHLSDGDNMVADSRVYAELVAELASKLNLFGYGEVGRSTQWETASSMGYQVPERRSPMMDALADLEIGNFVTASISDGDGVWPALKRFFGADAAALETTP